jgi:glycosyltransferase involved in cell wall biosynthesis
MIRVLHLLGRAPDFQTGRSAASLARELGADYQVEVRKIGRGETYRGVPGAVLGLRGRAAEGFDIVHAWDETALTVAALAGARRVVFSPGPSIGRRGIRWLRAVMNYRDVQVVSPTATQRRVCVERGIPLDRCHLIRPGVEFSRVRRRRDPALRAALGLGAEDLVLLAPGESTEAADHGLAVHAASILRVLDPAYRLLIWGRGPKARRAAALADRLRQPDLVRVAEARLGRRIEFEELLPAADIVLVTARGPVATLPIAVCMAAALPIVSTVTYSVAELLEDRHTAVMVPRPAPRLITKRLLELRADPQLQWSISDMARTEAYEYFSHTRFVNQWRGLYRQLAAGEPVQVVEPAPGAGLRFHGRG